MAPESLRARPVGVTRSASESSSRPSSKNCASVTVSTPPARMMKHYRRPHRSTEHTLDRHRRQERQEVFNWILAPLWQSTCAGSHATRGCPTSTWPEGVNQGRSAFAVKSGRRSVLDGRACCMPPPPRGVTQCGPALGARFTLGHAVYDGGTCFDLLRRRPITPRSASSQDHNLVAARGATRDAPMSNPAHAG
jgi:hypothetical protein